MKTTLFPLLAMFLLITLACNKPQEDVSPDTSFFFKCKIDGNDFDAETTPLVSFGAHLAKKGDYFNIVGKNNDGNGFAIWLEGPLEEGTFVTKKLNATIQTSIIYELVSPFQNWSTYEDGGSGTITIKKNHSQYLEGTFSFTGVNAADGTKKVFSSGSFRAKKL